jgi:response regulator of citrate/malate metabolism
MVETGDLSASIIEPDPQRRRRCADAARANMAFKRVISLSNIREFQARIDEGENFDLVFIGGAIRPEQVQEIIKVAKHSHEDCVTVLVLGAGDQHTSQIAKTMIQGIDGFLCEPFSVDALSKVTDTAYEVRRVNQEKRLVASLRILVNDLLDALDERALLHSLDRPTLIVTRRLQELSASIQGVQRTHPTLLDRYYEILIELSDERKAPVAQHDNKLPSKKRKDRQAARWGEKKKGPLVGVRDL